MSAAKSRMPSRFMVSCTALADGATRQPSRSSSAKVASGPTVTGSLTIPDSDRFTFNSGADLTSDVLTDRAREAATVTTPTTGVTTP